MFLIPNESITMGKVMTILLTPFKKKKIFDHQVLPYKMWSEKLCKKVSEWYKVYHENGRNKVNVSIIFCSINKNALNKKYFLISYKIDVTFLNVFFITTLIKENIYIFFRFLVL